MNAPPPMPDPVKLSRMIQLLNDYVREGLIAAPSRPFTTMTESELDDLLEAGRQKREAETNPAPEPEPESPQEPAMPEPSGNAPEPQPQGANMPEGEGQKMTEQEFYEKFPKGTHIDYGGDEYVVEEQGKPGAEGNPHLQCMLIYPGNTTLELPEFENEEFREHESPTKVPQKTEYPPQVFLVAWQDDSGANAAIYKDLNAVKNMHPDIDGDAIMEAISDPGTPQVAGDLTITFAAIG